MDLETLIGHAETAGVNVYWANLKTCNAGYDHRRKTIWLDHSLASEPRNAASILAHELAHFLRGDEGPQPASVERRCDMIAAGMLINPGDYATAERIYEGDINNIAVELGVTARLVRAYQDALAAV